jgi:hypothetical protein
VSYFYGVRGWVQCVPEDRPRVLDLIARNEHENSYNDAWVHGGIRNWTGYVFFGCDVNYPALDAVRQQVRAIAETIWSVDGEDVDYVEGLLHIDAEDGARRLVWELRGGRFTESPAPGTTPAFAGDSPYRP